MPFGVVSEPKRSPRPASPDPPEFGLLTGAPSNGVPTRIPIGPDRSESPRNRKAAALSADPPLWEDDPAGGQRAAVPKAQGVVGVPLSEDEQRLLHQIEQQFYESDPEFARSVSQTTIYRHAFRNVNWGVLLFLGGVVMLLFTLSVHFLLAFVGVLIMLVAPDVHRAQRPQARAGGHGADDEVDASPRAARSSATPASACATGSRTSSAPLPGSGPAEIPSRLDPNGVFRSRTRRLLLRWRSGLGRGCPGSFVRAAWTHPASPRPSAAVRSARSATSSGSGRLRTGRPRRRRPVTHRRVGYGRASAARFANSR